MLLFLIHRPFIDFILVSRLHPLTRRNGLVNQLEFLGLPPTFLALKVGVVVYLGSYLDIVN